MLVAFGSPVTCAGQTFQVIVRDPTGITTNWGADRAVERDVKLVYPTERYPALHPGVTVTLRGFRYLLVTSIEDDWGWSHAQLALTHLPESGRFFDNFFDQFFG